MEWNSNGPSGTPGAPGTPGTPGEAGPPGPGGVTYYAEQSGTVTASTMGDWIDIDGAAVSFMTSNVATLDIVAHGGMTCVLGVSPWVRCAVRFVVDGFSIGDPSWGNMIVSPGRTGYGTGEWTPFSLMRRATVGGGSHTVRTELTKTVNGFGSDLSCQIDGPEYAAVHLLVTVR